MGGETGGTADAAFEVFCKLLADASFVEADGPELSEADTRCKLIDPVFVAVLGWPEAEIRREEPVAEGFADYVFGVEYAWLHVEAKRVLPRFSLKVPSKARRLKLSGPHLLANKDMRGYVEQAAKYSPDLGTEFAVLTNGPQLLVFCTRMPGRAWRDGVALVWHGYEDIKDDFAEFYNLLSYEAVQSGSLYESFHKGRGITSPRYTPLTFIHNPDRELVRNPFWNSISHAFSPLLTDQPENEALQNEIVKHCYVTTPLALQSSRDIGGLLRDLMPAYLREAGVQNLDVEDRGRHSFGRAVVEDLKSSNPGTHILTGGRGAGKTTFLRWFATESAPSYISEFCVWLHIDFLEVGSVPSDGLASAIESYTYERVVEIMEREYASFLPGSGAELRELFADEIRDAEMTHLYGLPRDSRDWNKGVNDLVAGLRSDPARYVNALLRKIDRAGRCVVFVLDNTDQQGEEFQEAVFLFSKKLSRSYRVLSIVSLREEKFFAAYRRGIFDAYGTRKFHIGSPDLCAVVRRRLEYGLDCIIKQGIASGRPEEVKQAQEIEPVVRTLARATTGANANILLMLASVSNGDIRHALEIFRDFMSSGNTDIKKIQYYVGKGEEYRMPFHEFAKSAILGTRRFYKGSVSRVVNVFTPSSAQDASHMTGCRILSRLTAAAHAPSRYGEGFVLTRNLLREYRLSFGRADDFVATAQELLERGLLESEPPRVPDIAVSEALCISAAGAYYWNYLVRSFAYLDLVFVDAPISDYALAQKLAWMAPQEKHSMTLQRHLRLRFERVRLFLDYLSEQERAELEQSLRLGGPYREMLTDTIKQQIEREIAVIAAKTGS